MGFWLVITFHGLIISNMDKIGIQKVKQENGGGSGDYIK